MTLQDYFIRNTELRNEWALDLNREKPDDLKPHSRVKVWWRYGDGHVWQAVIYSRTRKKGAGCPVCAGVVKQSLRTAQTRKERAQPRALRV